MIDRDKLMQRLAQRRRSVEAEIKRIEREAPADDIRAASNGGYLAALGIELAFLISILEQ